MRHLSSLILAAHEKATCSTSWNEALTVVPPFGAQPLLGLSAAQGQQLVAVSARYRRQTCELVAARNELYLSMRPAPLPRPSASSEEMIRDFLQACALSELCLGCESL